MPFQFEKIFPSFGSHPAKTESKQEYEQKKNSNEYTLKIYFLSFQFSQGSDLLQEDLWRYLHVIRPEWRITEEKEQFIKDKAPAVFEQFLWREQTTHLPLSRQTLQWSESQGSGLWGDTRKPQLIDLTSYLHGKIDIMKAILNNQIEVKRSERENLVRKLAQKMLDRDRKFIAKRRRGRPREGIEHKLNAQTDPFLSYICYYTFEPRSTGVQEYDQMFQEIKNVFLTAIKKNNPYLIKGSLTPFTWDLAEVARTYIMHHPESTCNVILANFLKRYNK